MRKISDATWSPAMNCWYIPEEKFRVIELRKQVKQKADIIVDGLYSPNKTGTAKELHKEKRPVKTRAVSAVLPDGYLDLLLQKNYSKNTIKTYTAYFKDFLVYFKEHNTNNLSTEEINKYIIRLINERNISTSQQNQRINAIKFYYEKVLGRKKEYYHINRPKKEKRLPTILSKEEIRLLMESTTNLKHKCILMAIYSGGLRRSELINLRTEDIDPGRMLIKIRGAKGNKDRYTILSETLLDLLREYYKKYKPGKYLFEGQNKRQYSATSIEKIFKKAVTQSGIKKYVTPHNLRHSFATHLLEQGISLRHIQEILGHNSSKTTEIYTRVATNELGKIRNPLDG